MANQRQHETFAEKGYVQALIGAGLGLVFTSLLQARGDLPANPLVTLAGVFTLSGITYGIHRMLMRGGERAASSIYSPSGTTTAYTPTFSHIETLEIRGDLEGAARAWEEACAEHSTNALVHVKAADFHLRKRNDAVRAAELYRHVRAMGTANDDLRRYVGQKLADLYLGPLKDEGKAMGELRRLIDAFPGSREADAARAALAAMKTAIRQPP